MNPMVSTQGPEPAESDTPDDGGNSEPADTSFDDGAGVEQGNIPDTSDPDYQ